MQAEKRRILDEIEKQIKCSKVENLYENSCRRLMELIPKLLAVDSYENKKKARLEKDYEHTLKRADKRSVLQYEDSVMKDEMLSQQSKMAMMGDMMDSVAHQWKQPLNSLTMLNDMLVDDFKDGTVNEAYIADMTETSQMQIEHMVSTLSEFRTFFRPSKDKVEFSIAECIESVEILMKDELIKNNIVIEKNIVDDIILNGLVNEFKHVFLNLISNSKDAYNEKGIQNPIIKISVCQKDNKAIIEFEDNAQGIPNQVIADIFKANVTTKTDGKGTGIGLYMSSQIIQKHNGTIGVRNTKIGAIFTIAINIK